MRTPRLNGLDDPLRERTGHGSQASQGTAHLLALARKENRYVVRSDSQLWVSESTHTHLSTLTHEICVISWFSAANEIAALVATRGVLLAGKVASVASPTRKTLKSFERFS
jgi:hypothetical protein